MNLNGELNLCIVFLRYNPILRLIVERRCVEMQRFLLKYNEANWVEEDVQPRNTLQLFITDKCNLRCEGCFYDKRLGRKDMSFNEYVENVRKYRQHITKVNLLGGEPTIHPELEKMLEFNRGMGLETTIYTNGFDLGRLEGINTEGLSLRIGVHGRESSEKPLSRVFRTKVPSLIVYMLTNKNATELLSAADDAARDFNCLGFYISSIRRMDLTQNFWIDSEDTLPLDRYCEVVQDFVNKCPEAIEKLHIARRGLIYTKNKKEEVKNCRFGNLFPNGDKIICPFDISLNKLTNELSFNEIPCDKNSECILQKIVLCRRH